MISASFISTVSSTFLASIRSVGTACTLAAVGVYIHQRDLISASGKRMLALISQQVTFPLFLFTKIINCPQDNSGSACPEVTEALSQVWILLFLPLFVVSMGLWVGNIVSIVTRTPSHQRRSVMAAVGFGNSTGLPITLLAVVHANFSKTSELGRVDPTLFLSVYLLLYPVLQWGLGGWLLAPQDDDKTKNAKDKLEGKENKDIEAQDAKWQPYIPVLTSSTASSTLTEPPRLLRLDNPNIYTEAVPQLSTLQETDTTGIDNAGLVADDTNTRMTPATWLYNSSTSATNYVTQPLRTNVLNNKHVDQYYIKHRHGMYSSDEGLYLSELNLAALSQDALSQQCPSPSPSMYSFGSRHGSSVALLPPTQSQHSLSNKNNNNQQNGYITMEAIEDCPRFVTRVGSNVGTAPTTTARNDGNSGTGDNINNGSEDPEFLLYDTPDSTMAPSDATESPADSLQGTPSPEDGMDKNDNNTIEKNDREEKKNLLSENKRTTTYGSASIAHGNVVNDKKAKQQNMEKSVSSGPTTPKSPAATALEFLRGSKKKKMAMLRKSFSFDEFKAVDSAWTTIRNIGERCFQPPVIGAVSGILVAISPLRGWFVDVIDRDSDAPLEWLFDGLYSVGLTAVPINMIILGCNLSNSYNKFMASRGETRTDDNNRGGDNDQTALISKDQTNTNNNESLNISTMLGIVVGKMVVMPIIGFISAYLLQTFVLDIPDAIDAPFYLVLLIVFLTPTANNVMVMVELSGSNTKEAIANVIALQYATAPIILSCTMTVAIGYALTLSH